MAAKWPAMTQAKGAKLDNDAHHNFEDPNGGGGSAAPVVRNSLRVSTNHRGGFGSRGTARVPRTSLSGRGGTGNPANRGGFQSEGRNSFTPEARVPGHGGSPQVRDNMNNVSGRGGFGNSGQRNVPSYTHANPSPGAGNLSGRMAARIAKHFDNKSKHNPNRGVGAGPAINRGRNQGSGI